MESNTNFLLDFFFNCIYNYMHRRHILTSFTDYRSGALRRGIPFELTKEQFRDITNNDCIYCGAPKEVAAIGIDRIDNEFGYTTSNCVPCCRHCNTRKLNLPLDVFALRALHIRIMKYMRSKGFSYSVTFEE
jgi:hypothetical protein